jgi:hypothetical protein
MSRSLAVALEPAERRRQMRYTSPIRVTLGTETAVCVNWSFGGFLVRGFKNIYPPGRIVAGRIEVDGRSGAFLATILRLAPDRHEVGARFVELDPAIEGVLRRLAVDLEAAPGE